MQTVEELREIIAEQQLRIATLDRHLEDNRLLLEGIGQLASADETVDPFAVVFRSLHEVFAFDDAAALEEVDGHMRCIAAEEARKIGLELSKDGPLRRVLKGRVVASDIAPGHPLWEVGGQHMLLLPTKQENQGVALVLARAEHGFDRAEIDLGRRFAILAQQAWAVKRFAKHEAENRRLIEINAMEAQARQAAQAASQAKSRFLASMSHEIRTPMNGIMAMAELLESSQLTEDQWHLARTISSSANALLTVINDILDFSKVEADQVTLRQEPFDLAGLIFEVGRLLIPRAAEKGVELCVETPPDLPQVVMGDAARLRQILLNLVGNAVKFTEAGHVRISVALQAEPGQLRIAVQDTGIGIPADQTESVFSAFERVDEIEKGHIEGTGLGLAICLRLVRLMKGTLTLESALGAGSVFTVDLCLPAAPRAELDRPAPLLAGQRVALVEPCAAYRRVVGAQLAALGAEVEAFETRAGFQEALDQAPRPDAVLIGCVWPDDHLPRFMQEIADWKRAQTIPFILVAGGATQGTAVRKLGFDDVLMKPARSGTMGRVIAAATGAETAPEAAAPQVTSPAPAEAFDLKVLVAEDNRTNQLVMRKMLGKLGIEPEIVENGAKAVERAMRQSFDLILMDVSMPVMDGLEATRRIRAGHSDAGSAPPPIVALTAHALEEHKSECLRAGMVDFLTKPISRGKLEPVLAAFAE